MGSPIRTDAELIAACRGGDRDAFGEIVERYQRAVGAVAYSATRDRTLAQDVTQDTFVTAWRQLPTLRDVDRLPAWLCGIARNLARTARRTRGRETLLDDHDVATDSSPYDRLRDREDEHVVATSLAKVPETYREALVLFYCEQQSVKAVAHALGITENATHQRLARGRQHLADQVGLVERTLERRRPQAGLAVAVLAAITALGSSHVEAATLAPANPARGSTMFKFGIAAALLSLVAGTGYVVARTTAAPARTAIASTPAAPSPVAPPTVSPPSAAPPRATPTSTTSVSGARDGATTAAASDDALACSSIANHLAMMTVLTQPDVVQAIEHGADDFVDVVMKPIADGYLEDCTELAWSHEVRACIADAADFVSLQTTCEPPPTLGRDRPGGAARGEIQIIDDAPRPAYTGSDESCASVGQHMLALQRPTEATLAQVPAERRAEIQVAMERSLTTLPESVEDNCEAMPWSLEERRCMLSATTYTKAIACTPHAR